MGRPERLLDPESGPMQSFAAGLRELRKSCGNPTYRTLAKRAHYSHTVISDAARGERLPTLAVTLAFVTACGGDPDEWRARWHLCQQQITRAPAPELADATGYDASGPRIPVWAISRPRVVQFAVAGVVAVLAAAGAVALWHRPAPRPQLRTTALIPSRITDGTDPKIAGCAAGATVLDRANITLPAAAVIGGRPTRAGTVIGTVSLRYSAHCAGAWARFDPAPGVYGDNPAIAAILLEIARPADGTMSTFRLPHVDEAYSDLLLTGLGCVTARASVELTGQPITATAQTRCLPPLSS
jgi:hypothetical protein